jgi:hypothetical protein
MNGLNQHPIKASHSLASPTLAEGQIVGEVRQPGMVYRLRLDWDGKHLSGRLGGAIFGENVHLEAHAHSLLGTVASSTRVFAVSAQLEGDRLEYRFAGNPGVSGATLWLQGNTAKGILYLAEGSQKVEAEAGAQGLKAWGDEAQHIILSANQLPIRLALSAALIADIASRNAWRVLLSSYGRGEA